jgi:hypothetical protein
VENVFPEHKLRCDAPRLDPGGGRINVSRDQQTPRRNLRPSNK